MWKRVAISLSALLVTFGIAASADAGTCGGVSMSDSKTLSGTTLQLNGMGIREATIFSVDVYVAGLYVENKSSDGSTLAEADSKKQLILHFVRSVKKKKIVEAYRESFQKLAGGESGKLNRLLGWMQSTDEGEQHRYSYIPGEGLTVEIGGSKKGTIEGDQFASTFFKIWLGPSPPNEGLKTGLLGGACG